MYVLLLLSLLLLVLLQVLRYLQAFAQHYHLTELIRFNCQVQSVQHAPAAQAAPAVRTTPIVPTIPITTIRATAVAATTTVP